MGPLLLLLLCLLFSPAAEGFSLSPQQGNTGNRAGAGQNIKVFYDDLFTKHVSTSWHPECPERVTTIRDALRDVKGIEFTKPPSLNSEEEKTKAVKAISRVHRDYFVSEMRDMSNRGGGRVDEDTYVDKDTFEVCVAAQSAWLGAVEHTARSGTPSFALTRPPGHHAVAGSAMGFCIFNFCAAAAFYCLDHLDCRRVAILDFDVHFGNGIASLSRDDDRIRYCSLHQGGIFPPGGEKEQVGPKKNLKNVPFYYGDDTWTVYGPKFEQEAVPWLKEFDADILIVSAGYDALCKDEMANMSLEPRDFGRMATILRREFGDKVVFGLEGGYHLGDTPLAVVETLKPFLSELQ